jgi:type IV secretory pathway VirB10-like protein
VPSLALAGGGAVALVVGGIFGVLALGQADQFHQTPQTKVVVSQQLKRDGQTYALVADISFLVGIAAAATGGVVWFTAPKGTEAPEPAAQRESARPIDSPTAGPAAPQPAPVKGETAKAEPEERKSKKRSKRQQRDDEEAERRRRDEEAKADEARNRRDAEQREAERKAEERRAADRKAAEQPRKADEGTKPTEARKADEPTKPADEKAPPAQSDRKKKGDEDHDDLRNF